MNTLAPPKSIRISKSLRKLKIKKRQSSARNDRNHHHANPNKQNHQMNADDNNQRSHRNYDKPQPPKKKPSKSINTRSSYNPHKDAASAFIEKLSELEGVNEDIEHQRIECRGCGRKFIQSALERHAKICKKVFQSKRKTFEAEVVGKDAKSAQGSGCDEYKLKKMKINNV